MVNLLKYLKDPLDDWAIEKLPEKKEKKKKKKVHVEEFVKLLVKEAKQFGEKGDEYILKVIQKTPIKLIDFSVEDVKCEYVLVRILRDLPPFLGVDGRVYRGLEKGTIARIPKENAEILIKNGDAERVIL